MRAEWSGCQYSIKKRHVENSTEALTDLDGFLLQPVWVPLVLAVHLHLLRTERQAAVTVEVEAVVSADVRPLLLSIAVLRLQKLRQTWLRPLGSGQRAERGEQFKPSDSRYPWRGNK